jgi:hypothetical protein
VKNSVSSLCFQMGQLVPYMLGHATNARRRKPPGEVAWAALEAAAARVAAQMDPQAVSNTMWVGCHSRGVSHWLHGPHWLSN